MPQHDKSLDEARQVPSPMLHLHDDPRLSKMLEEIAPPRHEIQNIASYPGGIVAVAITPGRQRVVTGACDANVKLWNSGSGRCLKTFSGYARVVTAGAMSAATEGRVRC